MFKGFVYNQIWEDPHVDMQTLALKGLPPYEDFFRFFGSPKDGRVHVVDFGDLTGLGPHGQHLMRFWLHLFHVEPRTGILKAIEAGSLKTAKCQSRL
jgi:hypothetical protein